MKRITKIFFFHLNPNRRGGWSGPPPPPLPQPRRALPSIPGRGSSAPPARRSRSRPGTQACRRSRGSPPASGTSGGSCPGRWRATRRAGGGHTGAVTNNACLRVGSDHEQSVGHVPFRFGTPAVSMAHILRKKSVSFSGGQSQKNTFIITLLLLFSFILFIVTFIFFGKKHFCGVRNSLCVLGDSSRFAGQRNREGFPDIPEAGPEAPHQTSLKLLKNKCGHS